MKIQIKDLKQPKTKSINQELKWVCECLGLINGRDVNKTSSKILNELLNQFKRKELVSSEDLSKKLKIETPRINHHLRNFIEAGILVRKKRKVSLRAETFESTIEEIKKDTDRIFNKILEITKNLDKHLGF